MRVNYAELGMTKASLKIKYTSDIPSSVLIKNQTLFVKPTPAGIQLLAKVLDWFKVTDRKIIIL